MLNTKINELIKNAMKTKDEIAVQVLRLIKAEFLKAEKEKSFKGWDDVSEVKILMKMTAQRKDSIEQYKMGGREDLAFKEQEELDYLEKFLPKQPSEEEITYYTQEIINEMKDNGEVITMKLMKNILSKVQLKYSTANGKIVSQIVKNNI